MEKLVADCGCDSIKSQLLATKAQDRYANALIPFCQEIEYVPKISKSYACYVWRAIH